MARTTAEQVRTALATAFADCWRSDAGGLDAVARYAITTPGKLLRPRLLCHTALALGGRMQTAVPAAIGLEAAHVGSLVHDDIIDHDAVRRRRPAVHRAFGVETAIIAGNALYFRWFAALDECGRNGATDRQIATAMRVQARTGTAVCRGAAAELDMAGSFRHDISAYLAMARGKTGALMACACHVGAIMADAPVELAGAARRYGESLGLAFQIRDDLLPYTAPRSMGKPTDSDLRNRRPTLPVLLGMKMSDDTQRQMLEELLAHPEPHSRARLRDLLQASGALAAADAMAVEHLANARAELKYFPHGPHREELALLAN
ncbi:polyprenyl synthetase family protein [Streptomyces sp. NPDC058964]|uniref:polyprenyl synthetase family protein n=1 Tax=Streptomyces sp. NPDC058964 TaxID=3346681 RepID=UPI0036BB5058